MCDKVSDLLKNSDRKDIECVIAASDERENAELSEYCFRYRPQKRKGFTLLHYAMIYGNSEVVKDLLQLGAGKQYTLLISLTMNKTRESIII